MTAGWGEMRQKGNISSSRERRGREGDQWRWSWKEMTWDKKDSYGQLSQDVHLFRYNPICLSSMCCSFCESTFFYIYIIFDLCCLSSIFSSLPFPYFITQSSLLLGSHVTFVNLAGLERFAIPLLHPPQLSFFQSLFLFIALFSASLLL